MTAQQDLYISKSGLDNLKLELTGLLSERRDITDRIKEAREFGDLSENAEYIEAKNRQSFIEGRIAEIEAMLKVAKVIDNNNRARGAVALGSKVKVEVGKTEREYVITGSNEASPGSGMISNESPMGRALMGRKMGEVVSVDTPDGLKEYKIISVK